jgi:hypothetical protein
LSKPVRVEEMTLQEAVKYADEHLAKGGTFPQGEPGNCFNCPVARYLAQLMDSTTCVKVNDLYVEAIDIDGVSLVVQLTPALCQWIAEYDIGVVFV